MPILHSCVRYELTEFSTRNEINDANVINDPNALNDADLFAF